MDEQVAIAPESPTTKDARQLIAELDEHLGVLYPPENRFGLSVSQLIDPSITFLVARIEGEAVGCGGIKLMPEGYAEVKRMYVRPAFRGMGIAQKILQELETLTINSRLSLLRLETGIHQTDAIRLYERAGWVKCSRFGDYPDIDTSVFFEKAVVGIR